MVALRRADSQVLFRRADDGTWCLPAGAAETGGSFARTAIEELSQEAGVEAEEEDLIPFGCLSEAELHTIHYPNGDVTRCFAQCFLVERWEGDPEPDGDESTAVQFAPLETPPQPLYEPSAHALEMLAPFVESGRFQVR
jgi:8-oxo-dGTP pyrophosphatase MutT (NUDIX family)